jgi:hypothetical protein
MVRFLIRLLQDLELEKPVRIAADAVLRTYGKVRARSGYDMRDTIVIASTGRGGSTWLTEIVATLPGYTVLWEPLHLGNNPECEEYGFGWQNYIPPGTEAPRRREYLRRILTGANLSTSILTSLEFRPLRLLRPGGGYIAKFVNVNMMLPWLMETFPVSGVLMIRHPCAVVASQMRHGAWDHVAKDNMTVPEGLFEEHGHLESVFSDIQTQEEVLAFEWAVQTYIPLSSSRPHPWFLTTYEELVSNGQTVLADLFGALGRSIPDGAYEQLYTPSATASTELDEKAAYEQLRAWRDDLSAEQIDQILGVAHAVGVTAYDETVRPDYDALISMTDRA